MDLTQQIPPYHDKGQHKKHKKDVVKKELRRQDARLKAAKEKNHKLKNQRDEQKARRKEAERALEQERSDAAKRELKIRIQTKLDDWAFYCYDGTGKKEGT